MQVKSSGQVLFDEVIKKLQVLEADYFDLQYTDLRNTQVRCIAILFWLNNLHSIVKLNALSKES